MAQVLTSVFSCSRVRVQTLVSGCLKILKAQIGFSWFLFFFLFFRLRFLFIQTPITHGSHALRDDFLFFCFVLCTMKLFVSFSSFALTKQVRKGKKKKNGAFCCFTYFMFSSPVFLYIIQKTFFSVSVTARRQEYFPADMVEVQRIITCELTVTKHEAVLRRERHSLLAGDLDSSTQVRA